MTSRYLWLLPENPLKLELDSPLLSDLDHWFQWIISFTVCLPFKDYNSNLKNNITQGLFSLLLCVLFLNAENNLLHQYNILYLYMYMYILRLIIWYWISNWCVSHFLLSLAFNSCVDFIYPGECATLMFSYIF